MTGSELPSIVLEAMIVGIASRTTEPLNYGESSMYEFEYTLHARRSDGFSTTINLVETTYNHGGTFSVGDRVSIRISKEE